ncbi:MAG: TetR/AcrR family transcriptional regulator [Phyllobacteriaceae bacterium]|nr:TetR/AcrR family transcriptional regulator [Phyllobacteriaceae bacterium]
MTKPNEEKRPYHHGDLRAALLSAAEEELAEKGVEAFTLRGVAKRAGVSHAAPAHHFRNVEAMLTALAAIGFRRLTAAMRARHAEAAKTPRDQFIASGVGYVDFALANPALFRLMFSSQRPEHGNADMADAGAEAFEVLVDDVAAVRGDDPMASRDGRFDVTAAWSLAHGLANLLIANGPGFIAADLARDRDGSLRDLIERVTPR